MNKFTQFSLAAVALLLTGGIVQCSDIIVNVDNQKKQAAKIEIDAHGLGIKNHTTMVPGMTKKLIEIRGNDLAAIRVYEEESPGKFVLKDTKKFEPWKMGNQEASTYNLTLKYDLPPFETIMPVDGQRPGHGMKHIQICPPYCGKDSYGRNGIPSGERPGEMGSLEVKPWQRGGEILLYRGNGSN
ncbi:MAG: hypothetical protein UU47_C0001G0083 [candidate division TM6 bacterium GW2011_GWE2_41_16]|nr:MAG: hypothetical protein UU47_C0001G0083 [candidate division TM6 bacterium GW2011_GWE2_41_16]